MAGWAHPELIVFFWYKKTPLLRARSITATGECECPLFFVRWTQKTDPLSEAGAGPMIHSGLAGTGAAGILSALCDVAADLLQVLTGSARCVSGAEAARADRPRRPRAGTLP